MLIVRNRDRSNNNINNNKHDDDDDGDRNNDCNCNGNRNRNSKVMVNAKVIIISLIINTYHFLIFYTGFQSINLTNVQLYLLGINIIVYICLYIFLYRFNENLSK